MTSPGDLSIVRTELLTAVLKESVPVARIEVTRVDFAPGRGGGLHLHPCPVVGYVIAGMVRYQLEGEQEQLLSQGAAFFEPANTRILRFDNPSQVEPASFAAFYLLPEGENRLIVVLD